MRWIAALILLIPAFVQVGQVPAGIFGHSTAASYTGPGDVRTSAMAFWAFRAYSAAQAAALVKSVQLCTASDALCTDIRVTSAGGLNASDITASGCGSINTCTIKILYDQSGANNCAGPCDLSQTIIASRLTFTNNAIGSLPCMADAGAGSLVNTTNFAGTLTQPFTVSMVAERTAAFTSFNAAFGSGTGARHGFSNSANTILNFEGSIATASASDSVFHAVQNTANGASSVIYVDGSSSTVSSGSNTLTTSLGVGIAPGTSNVLNGNVCEVGLWTGAFSGGDNASMNSNQHTYWGF